MRKLHRNNHVRIHPFGMDWTSLEAVCTYAELLAAQGGFGMTVVLRKGRNNYNIIHSLRERELVKEGDAIIHRTGSEPDFDSPFCLVKKDH